MKLLPARPPFLRLPALGLTMLLAGCVSDAPYDYGLGLEVIRMDENTRALLEPRPARPLATGEAQRYVRESVGTLERLHDRSLGHRTDTPEAHLIEFLRRRFAILAAQKAPITRNDLRRLAPDIAELREWESRQETIGREDPGAVTLTSDDAFDATDDISNTRRRGDRNEHRGHRDSDRRDHDHGRHEHDDHDRKDHDDHGKKDDDDKKR